MTMTYHLTKRETQVFSLMKQGKTNKEIGHDLGLLERTVKKYIQRMIQKAEARNRFHRH